MNIQRLVGKIAGLSLLAGVLLIPMAVTPAAHAAVFVSVAIAPPVIPVYTQPLCPGDGYIWTPGYWAYGPDGYYWVDGAWVEAPYAGALWTPGYWGYAGAVYVWHAGYWGPVVGYYGGVNYGFGYFGVGFHGGYWNHGAFIYNTAYAHVGPGIHSVYVERVNGPDGRPFDGRPGGAAFTRATVNEGPRGGGLAGRPAAPAMRPAPAARPAPEAHPSGAAHPSGNEHKR